MLPFVAGGRELLNVTPGLWRATCGSLVVPFHHMGPGIQTWIIRPGDKGLLHLQASTPVL